MSECDQFVDEYVYRVQSGVHYRMETLQEWWDGDWRTEKGCGIWGVSLEFTERFGILLLMISLSPPGQIELADNLFYLGAAGQILDTMEMGCRMGRNVANLLQA